MEKKAMLENDLYAQIGRLKMENDWLKKVAVKPTDEKRQIIDSTDKTFSIEEQCNLVDLPRSTFYYSEVGVSQEDLAIMQRMDKMYLEDPTKELADTARSCNLLALASVVTELGHLCR